MPPLDFRAFCLGQQVRAICSPSAPGIPGTTRNENTSYPKRNKQKSLNSLKKLIQKKITLLRVIPTTMRGQWHQRPQISEVVVVVVVVVVVASTSLPMVLGRMFYPL